MAEHWNGGTGGKGSRPRPYSVDQKTFDNNWENIFKKDKRAEEDAKIEDEAFDELEKFNKVKNGT
jgi:hypothetical protein